MQDTASDGSSWLPTEVFQQILLCLYPGDTSTIPTILHCMECSKRFHSMASLPLIWNRLYSHRWKYCEYEYEARRMTECDGDWFRMYAIRDRRDREVAAVVKTMSIRHKGRLTSAREISERYGRDCWDLLKSFGKTGTRDWRFSEAYWALQLQEAMIRKDAYRCLLKLHANDNSCSFEEGISTASSFFGVHYDEVKASLTDLSDQCRIFLKKEGVALPGSQGFDVEILSVEICRWMRIEGFLPAQGNDYHQIMNHFLHEVIRSNRKTLPLSLVCVFVSLARRLGLNAHPVSFPGHVHAWVGLAADSDEHIAVDVYNSATKAILSPADLFLSLDSFARSPEEMPTLLQPATTSDMVRRAVNNMLVSVQHLPAGSSPLWMRHRVFSAAVFTQLILAQEMPLSWYSNIIAMAVNAVKSMHLPLDAVVGIEPLLATSFPKDGLDYLRVQIAKHDNQSLLDDQPQRDRKDISPSPKYFVGLVVRRTPNSGNPQPVESNGIIVAWTQDGFKIKYGCSEPCFYITYPHCSLIEESEYTPVRLGSKKRAEVMLENILEGSKNAGRFFISSRVSNSGCIWLVPGDELQAKFPNDLEVGNAWMDEEDQVQIDHLI